MEALGGSGTGVETSELCMGAGEDKGQKVLQEKVFENLI